MNLYEAVFKRISTRTFQPQKLSKDDTLFVKNTLTKYKDKKGPFGTSFEFTFNINDSKDSDGKKIGTYGLIKNVPAFFGGSCENKIEAIIDFGYVFELVILELTSKDLGTCWLGGTFKRSQFPHDVKENEVIPAISPVGYRAENRSLVDKMLRSAAQSNNRLPFDTLFLDTNLKPLHQDRIGFLTECLLMVQKAPSASNKQPWRMIIDTENNIFHMFIERTKNYARMLKYNIQELDIGIALAHFEVGLDYFKKGYTRTTLENPPVNENWEYIISLQIRD